MEQEFKETQKQVKQLQEQDENLKKMIYEFQRTESSKLTESRALMSEVLVKIDVTFF